MNRNTTQFRNYNQSHPTVETTAETMVRMKELPATRYAVGGPPWQHRFNVYEVPIHAFSGDRMNPNWCFTIRSQTPEWASKLAQNVVSALNAERFATGNEL